MRNLALFKKCRKKNSISDSFASYFQSAIDFVCALLYNINMKIRAPRA